MDLEMVQAVLQETAGEIEHYPEDNLEINRILESLIRKVMGVDIAAVWLNEDPRLIREHHEGIREVSVQKKRGLLYQCFQTKQPAFYNALAAEKDYDPTIDNPTALAVKSGLFIPLTTDEDRLIGIVACYTLIWSSRRFSREDIERFQTLVPFLNKWIVKMLVNRGNNPASIGWHEKNRSVKEPLVDSGEKAAQTPECSQLSKILDSTAAFVHDIRTPANGLAGFLDLLHEQIRDRRLREYITHARESAELINELTTSILDNIAERRIQQSSRSSWIETLNYFAEIAELFSAKMYEKRIRYSIFVDPQLPEKLFLEPVKLKRVLMNLLGNAVKFTPEKGSIEYSIEYLPREYSFRCRIKDSGIGIPKERQAAIFQPFTQADDTTRIHYGGSGLGLSLSADFVKEMGGELRLKSKPGQGSLFSFDLPIKGHRGGPSHDPVEAQGIRIGILAPADQVSIVVNIMRYLTAFGVSSDRIKRLEKPEEIESALTHLLLFEDFLSPKVLENCKEKGIRPLVVEEHFLSLETESLSGTFGMISCYDFYGKKLYDYIRS
ncbi:ATP-binding protein [Nitratifractor sp.]|uniref:GAF domain-containing sensor histidine kinase n=1 Tax=Nitratifractor sp. TaxID=2268144 RepID=UPI0025D77428|nr:ATP-binding protein [Nitratifractor sp.]